MYFVCCTPSGYFQQNVGVLCVKPLPLTVPESHVPLQKAKCRVTVVNYSWNKIISIVLNVTSHAIYIIRNEFTSN